MMTLERFYERYAGSDTLCCGCRFNDSGCNAMYQPCQDSNEIEDFLDEFLVSEFDDDEEEDEDEY